MRGTDLSSSRGTLWRHPGPAGLPLEIYAFTKTADWEKYEAIQADIFSHLLATVPQFGLRVFQEPSGMDLQGLLERVKA